MKLDVHSDECRKTLRLGFGEVDVIARAGLSAGDGNGEAAGAGAEYRLALDKRADGIGLSEFCHDDPTQLTIRWLQNGQRHKLSEWDKAGASAPGVLSTENSYRCLTRPFE